jgi:hypothetical protein
MDICHESEICKNVTVGSFIILIDILMLHYHAPEHWNEHRISVSLRWDIPVVYFKYKCKVDSSHNTTKVFYYYMLHVVTVWLPSSANKKL